MTALQARALLGQLDALAGDVGRLRRRLASDVAWSGGYIVDRIATAVESIDLMLRPSAGELAGDEVAAGADEAAAVTRALTTVDRRSTKLRGLLGEAERWA